MHGNFCRQNGTTRHHFKKVWLSHVSHVLQNSQNKPHHILLPSFLTPPPPPLTLSIFKIKTPLLTTFLSIPHHSENVISQQLPYGMPYLFSKQAQFISFSNRILKYKLHNPSLSFVFVFFLYFFFFSFPFRHSAWYALYFSSTGTQPDKYWVRQDPPLRLF